MSQREFQWDRLTSFTNLLKASEQARRGKRDRADVLRFEFHLEKELWRLHEELRNKSYEPGTHRTFYIYDPKQRLISAAPYRDRVVHHALCRVMEPLFERRFIFDSYACRCGKGTHAAVNRFTKFARRYAYVLKGDVVKFFPSVDHDILKQAIRRVVNDADVLWLADRIIDRAAPQESGIEWFFGDSLFTPTLRRRGLPIGNQTSQFFGNVYLDPFDHYVCERIRPSGYIRYCDDFVLFSNDKSFLHEAREQVREYLRGLRLRLHPNKSTISRVRDGTPFLGYRIFPSYRRLPRANIMRLKRRLARMQSSYARGESEPEEIRQRLVSWIGHARHANTFRLRESLFAKIAFVRAHENSQEGL